MRRVKPSTHVKSSRQTPARLCGASREASPTPGGLDDYTTSDMQTHEVPANVRPTIQDRFPVVAAREVIKSVLREKLVATKADKVTAELTKDIAETVKLRLKDLVGAGARYKLFTHVVLGEGQGKSGDAPPRGAGLHVSTRCLWDPTCDGSVCEVEATDALFAVATAYAVYAY